jgi:membrane fusion protein, multidrug efflux system
VINSDHTAEMRPVTVAQISEGQALINTGHKADERVVVDGQYKLEPGSAVTILHGQAAKNATAQQAAFP